MFGEVATPTNSAKSLQRQEPGAGQGQHPATALPQASPHDSRSTDLSTSDSRTSQCTILATCWRTSRGINERACGYAENWWLKASTIDPFVASSKPECSINLDAAHTSIDLSGRISARRIATE